MPDVGPGWREGMQPCRQADNRGDDQARGLLCTFHLKPPPPPRGSLPCSISRAGRWRGRGKRLNGPNDLVYRSDGTLFFSDPPFGLPKVFEDPRKELKFSGVYSVYKGKLQVISKDFTGPNGIAFSPDEEYFYVGDWDEKKRVIQRYEVTADGELGNGKLFFDMTSAPGEDALDGIKVDLAGDLYVSGPGGLWVISTEGKHLGTIIAPKHVHNMAGGEDDGKTLYLWAERALPDAREYRGCQPRVNGEELARRCSRTTRTRSRDPSLRESTSTRPARS